MILIASILANRLIVFRERNLRIEFDKLFRSFFMDVENINRNSVK